VPTTLDDAQQTYFRALRDLQLSDGEAYARVHREYLVAVESAQSEYQERCAEAAHAYTESGGPDAYNDYLGKVQRAWAHAQDRFAEACKAQQVSQETLWNQSGREYRNAFLDYVRSLKEGIAALEVERVSPEMLLTVAQGIAVAAQWAAATPTVHPFAATEESTESEAVEPRSRKGKT